MHKRFHSRRLACGRPAAFSLVEVAVAMGIFTFALVSLLALMPTAMQSTRDSLNLATALQLADKLAVRLNQADFNSLVPGGTTKLYYFDDLGDELLGPERAIYKANTTVAASESANLVRASISVQPVGGGTAPRIFSYLILNNE